MSSKSSHCAHNACSSIGNTYIHTYANINTPTHTYAHNVFGQILKAYFCGRVFCLPPAVWTLALALATALALGLFVLPPTALPSGLCCYPCSSSSSDSTSWSSCHTMPHLQQQQQRLRLVPAISK